MTQPYHQNGWTQLKEWAASLGYYWCGDCEDWVNENDFRISHNLSGYCKNHKYQKQVERTNYQKAK